MPATDFPFGLELKDPWKSTQLFSRFFFFIFTYEYPQLVSETEPDRGIKCDEASLLKVCEYKGCRPRLTRSHMVGLNDMKWKEMNELSVRNSEIKFVVGKTGETPRKTYPDSVLSTTKPTWSDEFEDNYYNLIID